MGGDVPSRLRFATRRCSFSPCGRGCSVTSLELETQFVVFPVWAGMFRHRIRGQKLLLSFPRVGGDVPSPRTTARSTGAFSPCGRGCSGAAGAFQVDSLVFPVWAGMFRRGRGPASGRQRFPRVGGDVPTAVSHTMPPALFSPCGRGCSAAARQRANDARVFPVWAGMFRRVRAARQDRTGFPRTGMTERFPQGQAPGRALPPCHPCPELLVERQSNAEPHEKDPIVDPRLRSETGFLQSKVMLGRFEERLDQPPSFVASGQCSRRSRLRIQHIETLHLIVAWQVHPRHIQRHAR